MCNEKSVHCLIESIKEKKSIGNLKRVGETKDSSGAGRGSGNFDPEIESQRSKDELIWLSDGESWDSKIL